MSATSWIYVKPKVIAEIDSVKALLLTCEAKDLPRLQARAAALQSIVTWFDDGAPEDRKISEPGGY